MVGEQVGEQAGDGTGETAAAGWYDDPLVPGGQRYWDGRQWTEAVQGPSPAASPGAPIGGPRPGHGPPEWAPPFDPLPPGAHAIGYVGGAAGGGGQPPGDKINDIGDWLSRTFTVIFAHWQAVTILALFAVPFWALSFLVGHQALSGVRWTIDTGDLSGFNGPLIAIAVVIGLLAVAASAVSYLAAHHYLYAAHIGRPIGWGRSLLAGLARQPRFLGLTILVYGVAYAVAAVPFAVLIIGLIRSSGGVATPLLLSLVLGLAAFVFLVWFWLKAAVFLPVAAAVVPRGTSALKAGWQVSDGRFWPILGRVGVMFALTATASTVAQIVAQSLAPTVLFSKFELTAGDQLVINGQNLDNIEVLRFGDVLPNPVGMLVYLGLIMVFSVASQMISASAVSSLYADCRGPNTFDH